MKLLICVISFFANSVFSQSLMKQNTLLIASDSVTNKDTSEVYSIFNKKIIIYKDSTYFLTCKENDGERICIEKDNVFVENISPFIPDYMSFKYIPKAWDIENSFFWGLNGVFVRTDGHPLYIAANGVLEKIPLSRLDSWTGKNIHKKDFPQFDAFKFNRNLPLNKLTYENYYLKRKAREKFEEKYEDKKIIFDRLIKTTYFDILTTKDGTPNYILYFENKISVWKLINDDWINYGTFDFSTNGFFTCFEHQKALYLIDYNSTVYKINKSGLEKVTNLPDKLIDIALVINKDTDTISYIKQKDIKNAASITQLIKEKSISIFKK